MINFFSFPLNSRQSRDKFYLKSLSLFLIIFSVVLLSGCGTMRHKAEKGPSIPPNTNIAERLKNAEAVKASLIKHLEHPKSVDETIRIKEHLDKLQDEIDLLKAGKDAPKLETDKDLGFKSVKDRKIELGPLGAVIELTKDILEKLLIWDKT